MKASSESEPGSPRKALSGRDRAASRWVTVEPVVIAAMLSMSTATLVKPLYVKSRIMESYNVTQSNSSEAACGQASDADTVSGEVQAEASKFLLYLSLSSGIPAILTTIVTSTMSDGLGRKLAMGLPISGYMAQAAVILATILFELPLPVLFAGEILQGITGGFGLCFAGCISYITDVTSVKQRTMRIVIAEMLTLLVGGLNELGQGFLIQWAQLPPTMVIVLVANLVVLVYIIMPPFLIETVETKRLSKESFKEAARSIWKLLRFNEHGRRWHVLLLNCIIFLAMCQITGAIVILVLYGTAKPFCWGSTLSGIALAATFVSTSIGMPVGTKLFSMCMGEYWLMQLSCLSTGLLFAIVGLAKSTAVIFVGILAGCLRGITIPIARSILSRITSPDETGATFAIVGCFESVSTLVSASAATGLYAATVTFMPSLTFFLYAAFTVVPAGIIILMQIFWPRRNQYVPFRAEDVLKINAD